MIIYLVVFGSSAGLFYIAQNVQKNRKASVFFSACAILLPALLAGLRDYSIGTDVLGYGNVWFYKAVQSKSVFQYCSQAMNSSIGLLYALFNYIVSIFSDNPHVFYFFYALVEILIVYCAVRKATVPDVPFAIFVYYCLFYNLALNMLRQSMALVIILYGFDYIKKKKLVRYLLSVAVASLFHSSGVVGIVLYILHGIINGKNQKFWQRAVIAGSGAAIIFIRPITKMLLKYGLLEGRYVHYLMSDTVGGGVGRALFFAPLVCLFFFFSKEAGDSLGEYNDIKIYAMLSFLLSAVGYQFGYAVRIAYYFDILLVAGIPLLVKNLRIRLMVGEKNFVKTFFIIYLLAYWLYKFVYKGSDATVPYIMMSFERLFVYGW